MEQQGRFSTARNYRRTRESIDTFLHGREIQVSDLSPAFVNDYNDFLYARKDTRNSVSFYNRVLRALYNKGIQKGHVSALSDNPFANVYTGQDRTKKLALDKEIIRKIISLDLHDNTEMDLSKDLFLFSFYTRGMCFVDMSFLSLRNICNSSIFYARSKTRQRMEIQLEPCMEKIMCKWQGKASMDYIFPIVHSALPQKAFVQYRYRLDRHNLMLKKIGDMVDAPFPLNSKTARHSWATLARDADIPVSVISQGMGHSSERTTRIYLADLDKSILNKANQKVIGSVLGY